LFFSSKNLKNWTQTGTFEIKKKDDKVWECPDLFPLNITGTDIQRWVLIINMNPGGYQKGSGARYFIGSFDGKTFVADDPDSMLFVDYGSDYYAVQTFFNVWNDPRNR